MRRKNVKEERGKLIAIPQMKRRECPGYHLTLLGPDEHHLGTEVFWQLKSVLLSSFDHVWCLFCSIFPCSTYQQQQVEEAGKKAYQQQSLPVL